MRTRIVIPGMLLGTFLAVAGCKTEFIRLEPDNLPLNPFDTIDYGEEMLEVLDIDSASFLGLHTYIFQPTCAVPGCHDGNFEPDFRTVQSSYNTLLYAPVIKNDDAGTFTYRVIPGDTALSWLHERITTDDEVLGRMPLYDTLYPAEREKITTWILDGAKDVMGNSPSLPNYQPVSFGFIAYENDTLGIRLDENRADAVSPIGLPDNTMVEFWFGVYDTDEYGSYLGGWDLDYNKVRISKEPYFFTDPAEYSMEVLDALTPYIGPLFWDPLVPVPYYHHFTINTADFDPGSYYFMRFYVDDGDHPEPTEIPNTGSPSYLLTYFSFYIQE
ncbi:MAG: hypothetical protein H6548_06440 [Chitinophagales bacterium]|nr:hypothetical protein [Chitinophagales bacterium]MCB9020252.1 hypothetical protein [Chitinophagales bacterium]MCB9021738.1 hypothetical protein [Chitinophagales bacterium]MCB9031011.1 hypothetical protein [Chitinophagales bacterium]HPE96399.1 hypothetical protein [Chitinophagales bacterium]